MLILTYPLLTKTRAKLRAYFENFSFSSIAVPSALFFIHFLVNLPGYNIYITPDEGALLIRASYLERNVLPYVDYYERQSPFSWIFLFSLWKLFAITTPYARLVVSKLLFISVTAMIGVSIYLIGKNVYHRRSCAIFASLLFLLSHQRYYLGSSVDNRYFSLMFITVGTVLLFEDVRTSIISFPFLLVGLGVFTRPEMALFVPFFFMYDVWSVSQGRIRRILKDVFSLILPSVIAIPFFVPMVNNFLYAYFGIGTPPLGIAVAERTPSFTIAEKLNWLQSGLRTEPLIVVSVLTLPLFLHIHIARRKKVFLVASSLWFISYLFFFQPYFASYWLLYISPFMAVVGGSIALSLSNPIPFLRVLKSKISNKRTVPLVMIYLLLAVPFIYFATPNMSAVNPIQVYQELAQRPKNVYLDDVLEVVVNYTDTDDYVIITPFVAFLSGRKYPPNLWYNASVLADACDQYDVKLINIFPFEGFGYIITETNKFINEYVKPRYLPVYETLWTEPIIIDPHYGKVWVRNDVILEKQGCLVFEYDIDYVGDWHSHNWAPDVSTLGASRRLNEYESGKNVWVPKEKVGNNYLNRNIWLPSGIYNVYTRAVSRGNIFSFRIDNHTIIVKEVDRGELGDWELIKVGTFRIEEGVHNFSLSFIDGRLNDVQDYLLIERADRPEVEKQYVISIPIMSLPTGYDSPPDLWFDSVNTLIEISKKHDVKLIVHQPAFFDELDAEIQAFLSYVKTHFSPVPEYSDEFGNKQVYVRNDFLLQQKGQLLLEYDAGLELNNWGIDVTSGGTYGVNIWCPQGEVGDNYIKKSLWLPNGTYEIYTQAYARGNTLHFKVDDADIIIEEPLVGEFGEWTLIKLGTVYLEEGIYAFSISFIGGTMNDIQDYLLIVKVV